MKGIRRFQDRLKADLKDPKVREAFEREEIFTALAIQIARIRQDQGLSQADLARRPN
jgi:ribosome-binding protein aMBF1 (putative translation factor)